MVLIKQTSKYYSENNPKIKQVLVIDFGYRF